jgi:AraC-like DNA-binding protein
VPHTRRIAHSADIGLHFRDGDGSGADLVSAWISGGHEEVPMRQHALSRFPILGTRSLEEARDAVTRVYLEHELSSANDRLQMTLNAVSDSVMTLGYLTYQSTTTLVMPPTGDCYHVNLTTAGTTDADRSDGGRATTRAGLSGVVLSPQQRNTVHWTPDAEQLILKLSRRRLEDHLADLLGRAVAEVVDFDFSLDLTTPTGRSLFNAVEFLAAELDRPNGLAEMPLAREQLEAFVMTQLLHAGRHQFSDDLVAPAEPVRRGRLAPVLEYLENNADEPLTPQELARVGCMSVRTLHATFQQVLGESPMSYLRRIRLDHVRGELLRSDPETVRVTDVAMRWGFLHQSRFAQQYRERFGERPRDTLRLRNTG